MSSSGKISFSIKSMLPRTLFGRALLILIIPIFLLQIVTAFIFLDRHWSKMTSRMAANVAGEVSLAARAISENPEPRVVNEILEYVRQELRLDIGYLSPSTLEGAGQYTADGLWSGYVASVLYRELDHRIGHDFKLHADFETKRIEVWVQLNEGVMIVSLPQNRLFSSSSYIFLLWVIGTSALLVAVSVIFMRNQIRPIRRLAVAAERFGRGLEILGFKPQGALEVRQAAEAFLIMRKRIQRQISQRTDMLAGVSHDLRTPLTRMKLQLAMMGDSEDVQALRSDVDEMERMLGGYLDFVRGEGGEQPSEVVLQDMLEKIVSNHGRRGGAVSVDLAGLPADPVVIALREMAFERCLNNILNNASHYAQHVWLRVLLKDERFVVFVVEDDGPGIEEAQYDDVFKPFFRVDQSRSSETGGVGLGMPIAMDIVHSHGGKIWLDRSEKGGLAVYMQLPL